MKRIILHSDLNNFYASVECLYNPALRGKPVAVCGDPEARHGIVLAKNYPAKAHGIITGEAIWQAKQKCRDLVVVPPHFDRYLQFSRLATDIYASYSPQVEAFGLDECWIDLTGVTPEMCGGVKVADEIRQRIKDELGVTASVGVSYNKIFAKLGSDMKKPDATTVIRPDDFKEMVWPLPVSDLLYVGRATTNKLKRCCIDTIGDLATARPQTLKYLLGKNGLMIQQFARGEDTAPVSNAGAAPMIKSIGNSTTAPRDLVTDEDVKITMLVLCESVAARLRESGFKCRTVQVYLRTSDLEHFERQAGTDVPLCTATEIFDLAYRLYLVNKDDKPYRSIGVRVCNLKLDNTPQLSFFPEIARIQKHESLETALDAIRGRFGYFSVQRGVCLKDRQLSALDAKNDHVIHPVGFLGS